MMNIHRCVAALILLLSATACAAPRRPAPEAARDHRRARVVIVGEASDRAALAARMARLAGRKLVRFDARTLLSGYIGETEKNLRAAFAAGGPGVLLFFDEADALFGRRTEVKDAHDRYANQEVSYLRAGGVVLVGLRASSADGLPQIEVRRDASDQALRALFVP